jgi:hypothetical protein
MVGLCDEYIIPHHRHPSSSDGRGDEEIIPLLSEGKVLCGQTGDNLVLKVSVMSSTTMIYMIQRRGRGTITMNTEF